MKSFKKILQFVFFLLMFYSCGEPTMEEDAQRAAQFSTESNQYAMDNDVTNAGRTYSEVQTIINKYKRMGKFEEFYQLYNSYLDMAAYEKSGGDDNVASDSSSN